ncbi:MAG: integrase family protein [Herbinix sp.]|jgi:integrase|nr:integrase family protein [Herbinix sp.]
MSVQKKGNKWYAAVYLGIKDGEQEYDWSDGFDKKEDAQLIELEMKANVIKSNHKVYDKELFSSISDKWLKMRKITVAKTTFRTNSNYYRIYIKDYFKGKLTKDIDSQDIFDFMMQIGKSAATVNKAMNILKQIFDFAISLHQIRTNPCIGIKKPTVKKKKKKTWNEKSINLFLSLRETKSCESYTAYLIMFTTGMRPGEVCGLRWCDWIDDYFIPTLGVDDHGEYTDLKNDKAHDPVFIDHRVMSQLNKLHAAQKALYRDINSHLPLDQQILPEESFINCILPDMRPMSPPYLRKRFYRIMENNKLNKIRLYDSRHSFGTNMMRNKVNPKQVAEMMRHTSVKTTLDNYSHVDEEMYKNTSRTYNDKIFKQAK